MSKNGRKRRSLSSVGSTHGTNGATPTHQDKQTPEAANVKKNYENKESWTPPEGTPPEPTDTPRDAAQARATDQPTNHEHPNRPHNHEANRGHAAATRSEGRSPGETGTRDTQKANQPNTRDQPNARTTANADGKGAEEGEPTQNMRQSYEKKQHEARKKRKKKHPKRRKPTRKQHPPRPRATAPPTESSSTVDDTPSRNQRRRHPTPQRAGGQGADQ